MDAPLTHRVLNQKKVIELCWIACGVLVGYFVGSSFHGFSSNKMQIPRENDNTVDNRDSIKLDSASFLHPNSSSEFANSSQYFISNNTRCRYMWQQIHEERNRCHLELLSPIQIFISMDLVVKPKYLLALAVGYDQNDIINEIVMKFSENFSIVLFHYDGRASEWDQFEWSHKAIHISASKQTKWWFAKRFLHPDIVSPYEYIFIWDEDLGVDNFNAEEYLKLVKKHGLEISQPGIESKRGLTWLMTQRMDGVEVHKEVAETQDQCRHRHQPPCAGFVEIMAPVFSRKSWECVWHMIQNDLVHGWGLDFAIWRCVQRPHEEIGVVDAQWVEHMVLPSLGDQGKSTDGRAPWEGVRARCNAEWKEFERRMYKAEHTN
ncbi:uncharacterized protein LOC130750034 isoform X2 [Actinidia eriantha]|uniref:uncharacterized protein LOC130750034 isoform X2 n=1 Tax=Actinidia eriantha TaxID=165200 RepID=UPI00258550BD|nr:uncharacterized protein LOC130750034 isoform X2 [Actinidia eriantha]